jgi:uncharacterized membrane protein (UPF0136 family)
MPESVEARPQGLVVVAAFLYAGAGIALLIATVLLGPRSWLDELWRLNESARAPFVAMGKASIILLVAVGALTFVAARGLLRGRQWAWRLATAIFAINVAGDVVRMVMGDYLKGGAGLLVGGGFLIYLLRRKVRAYYAT